MTSRQATPKLPEYYERIAHEIEVIAQVVAHRPELNHHSAERLRKIAQDIRPDVGLKIDAATLSSVTRLSGQRVVGLRCIYCAGGGILRAPQQAEDFVCKALDAANR